jgi:hypothetical protein
MSYTQTVYRTITIHYSGSVRYPASEHGGSVSYSGYAQEEVAVNVHVDTDPFDREVGDCNTQINELTGAVVATEAAQVASIHHSSREIGAAIVNGFFKTVQSDLSQQSAQLQVGIEATLGHLNELTKSLNRIKEQMTTDYNRLSSNYLKIFNELDSELDNRIHALEQPTLNAHHSVDSVATLGINTGSVTGTSVSGSEHASLEGEIQASLLKSRAMQAISGANNFLVQQQNETALLQHCLLDVEDATHHYAPVMYVETIDTNKTTSEELYASPSLEQVDRNKLTENMRDGNWKGEIDNNRTELIRRHFNSMLAGQPASSAHDKRVAKYITNLFNLSETKSLE